MFTNVCSGDIINLCSELYIIRSKSEHEYDKLQHLICTVPAAEKQANCFPGKPPEANRQSSCFFPHMLHISYYRICVFCHFASSAVRLYSEKNKLLSVSL